MLPTFCRLSEKNAARYPVHKRIASMLIHAKRPPPVPQSWRLALQGRLLETLPRELCEYLKVSAVVRAQVAALGGTIYDRLRINAVYALRVRPWPPAHE